MNNTLDIAKFEQLKASGSLPTPKGVALAIMRLTQKEDAAVAELARIIKADPAFVGRLIKAANSVAASPGRPVVSVQEALVLLGMPAVRNLALGFSLISQYKQGACKGFDYQGYWSGSLAAALAFQALALRTHAARPEETFSVGLLARVGELALATMFPDAYAHVLAQCRGRADGSLLEEERAEFAMNHRELTAAMLADWGVPKVFSEPVFHYEACEEAAFPEGSRQQLITRSLALARGVADICLAVPEERPAQLARLFTLGRGLGIEAEELKLLCDGVVREWLEWAAIFNLVARPLPPFEEMARVAQAEASARPEPGAEPSGLRLLLAVADGALRAALAPALARAGYEVFEAADSQEGLRAALECQPHMMVLEARASALDGLALARSLRETRLGRGLYILVLIEGEEEARLIEAFEAGADDSIGKPFSLRLLEARLQAGQRIVRMQQEIERDREEIRRFAAELAISNRRLQEVALTDALTGFPNRRYAMERMQQEWSAASRRGRPLACMMIDLDQFKRVNDTYGHDVGDAYLKQTAAAIRRGLRAQDVVCRTGGDEFLVICPDTDLPAALACAERVRGCVEASTVQAGGLRLKATLSVGVAGREPAIGDADMLIKRADQAVYLAKQGGRNRVASVQTRD